MSRLSYVLSAAMLIAAAFVLPSAAASDETRVVVYCDAGACPGVSMGDRADSCSYVGKPGYVGTCKYAGGVPPLSGGVGVGVLVGPAWQHGFCFNNPYCGGAYLEDNAQCVGGKQVRVFSHHGGVDVTQCVGAFGAPVATNLLP